MDTALHADVITVHHQEQPTTTRSNTLRHSCYDRGQLGRAGCSKNGTACEGEAGRKCVCETFHHHGHIYAIWIEISKPSVKRRSCEL